MFLYNSKLQEMQLEEKASTRTYKIKGKKEKADKKKQNKCTDITLSLIIRTTVSAYSPEINSIPLYTYL